MSSEAGRNPIVLAIVICDAIHVDRGTGKKTLLGTFGNIKSKTFPLTFPQIAVFLSLTEGYGKTKMDLKVVRVSADDFDDQVITSAALEVEFPSPRAVVDIPLALQNVKFEQAGDYRFQVFASDGTPLLERRFTITDLNQPPT